MGEKESVRVAEREKVCLFSTYNMQMRPVLQDLARRLREACKAGDAGAVRDLLDANADVNEQDSVHYCLTQNEIDVGCTEQVACSLARQEIQFESSQTRNELDARCTETRGCPRTTEARCTEQADRREIQFEHVSAIS